MMSLSSMHPLPAVEYLQEHAFHIWMELMRSVFFKLYVIKQISRMDVCWKDQDSKHQTISMNWMSSYSSPQIDNISDYERFRTHCLTLTIPHNRTRRSYHRLKGIRELMMIDSLPYSPLLPYLPRPIILIVIDTTHHNENDDNEESDGQFEKTMGNISKGCGFWW